MTQVWAVRDELWEVAEPLLPVPESRPFGRPRVPDRVAFDAIVFVLVTGSLGDTFRGSLGARRLPPTAVCSSGKRPECGSSYTPRSWPALSRPAASIARPWWSMAAMSVLFKGALTGPSPVDRARNGSKHHVITDAGGVPLAISLTGGNRHDVTQLLPLVDAIDLRAGRLLADRGYDYKLYRQALAEKGITALIARKNTAHGSGLGRERWVVERAFAWLHGLRRLRTRWERRAELHEAFMLLGCAYICQRQLRHF